MNGEVSASGTFPTSAAELQFYANSEQEPRANGKVAPDSVRAEGRVIQRVETVKTAGAR